MDDPSKTQETSSDRDRWAALLLILSLAALIGGGLWLVSALSDASAKLECLENGRSNCVPIPTTVR